jgi:large subunit ribosomal protein L25
VKFRIPGHNRASSGLIKSVQRHPLTGRALHVDYLLVNLKVEMEVDIPLVFVGEPPAVEETGVTLLHNLSSIRVKALPGDIPHEIEVNVSVLTSLDVAIHVRDLNLNRELVQVLTDGDTLVSTVVPPRIEEEPETVVGEGELEGEEGAEEGGEGEASAEGAESGEAGQTEESSEES